MLIECPKGTLVDLTTIAMNTDKPVFEAGIIPNTSDVKNYCLNSEFEDTNDCSSYLDMDKLTRALNDDCVGKEGCTLARLNRFYTQPFGMTDSACFQEDT